MTGLCFWRCGLLAVVCCLALVGPLPGEEDLAAARGAVTAGQVRFEEDVEPILRRRCSTCHGPEVQEGGLRLDRRDQAFAGSDTSRVIVPGSSADSLLIQLVSGTDPEGRRMPPEDEGPPLSGPEIDRLREWIDQGAAWPETAAEGDGAAAKHWSFQPVARPPLPAVQDRGWTRNPIDLFILSRLEAAGLRPAPEASKRALIRRLYLDLIGLPPAPREVDAFLADDARDAYERLVERLLCDPRYGERWGRHWLDLARYADTNGYEVDGEKPLAWKYRDYVIRALNEDKPYDRFVLEQLAGDELADATTETVIATGFLRVGPWDAERGASVQPSEMIAERYSELDDLVSTTSQVFLGLTMGCARCHNHKFDPLTARDYYSLVAIFNPLTRHRDGRSELALPALPPARLANDPPADAPQGYFLRETSPQPAETRLLVRGDPQRPGEIVEPAVPVVLVQQQPVFLAPGQFTSRRRLSLAHWVASPDNSLTSRVLVNRVWQYHLGQGLVRTPSDFGARGDRPSHRELLDWLADWFVSDGGWSLKRLHRLILTSNTYRMSKQWDARASEVDPVNRLLWRFPYRRLDLEAIRDSMLAASGQLNPRMYGPPMYPFIPDDARRSGYSPDKVWQPFDERDASRRTIYAFIKRTLTVPLFDLLDFCDTSRSADRRETTTVAPQALSLLNGEFVNRQAGRFADRLLREAGPHPRQQVHLAYRLALARLPTEVERNALLEFLDTETESLQRESEPGTLDEHLARRAALVQMCRAILNLNEFVYPD